MLVGFVVDGVAVGVSAGRCSHGGGWGMYTTTVLPVVVAFAWTTNFRSTMDCR